MPSPGKLVNFRLPGGPGVRVDTYGYVGCNIPLRYDSLLANLTVWAEDRPAAVRRMRRALQDFKIVGVQTNLPMQQQMVAEPSFVEGDYDTNFMRRMEFVAPELDELRPARFGDCRRGGLCRPFPAEHARRARAGHVGLASFQPSIAGLVLLAASPHGGQAYENGTRIRPDPTDLDGYRFKEFASIRPIRRIGVLSRSWIRYFCYSDLRSS